MKETRCPNCNSVDVEYKCHHNNRRKKVPIDVYFCKQCKKRFNVELDKEHYNHKGNLYQRRKGLYDIDLRKAEPDMKEDETASEYYKRKYEL